MLWKELIMDKKDSPSENVDLYLADILLRLAVLEKMLFEKNILIKEEYIKELEEIATKTSKEILKKVENSKNVKDFIAQLEEKAKSLDPSKVS